MRNAKNILRHELIGLECEVVRARNPQNTGIKGRIVDETMKTLVLKKENETKRIVKSGSVFRIDVGNQKVDVEGSHLVARPEDRIKKKFRKW
ncbi:MAG: ribonuclease P protein subunit [Candidatus Aenigmarchaeota archaeon]|nr:ribonuclease P protein subunit [Candidatus Aenigmarchaeota archaeon]